MAMATAADGSGYWVVASDGGIFAFDVPFYGSMGGTRLIRASDAGHLAEASIGFTPVAPGSGPRSGRSPLVRRRPPVQAEDGTWSGEGDP